MVDIIGAKCFSCGFIVRVPATLGGRKAKCPKCNGVIPIPTPGDSTMDFITDDQLPEVAKDEEVVDGEIIEEGAEDESIEDGPPDESEPEEEEEAAPRSGRDRPSAIRRNTGTSKGTRAPQTRRRGGPSSKSSSTGIIIGVVLALAGLVAVIALIAMKKGGPTGGGKPIEDEGGVSTPKPSADETAKAEVTQRWNEWIAAINNSDVKALGGLYATSEAARKEAVNYFDAIFFKGKLAYRNARDLSITMGKTTAALTFTVDRESSAGSETDVKISQSWEKTDSAWLLTDKPAK